MWHPPVLCCDHIFFASVFLWITIFTLEVQLVRYWNQTCHQVTCRLKFVGCVCIGSANLRLMCIVSVYDKKSASEIEDMCCIVLQWSGFSKFGLHVLLHFVDAPPEGITENPLPGSNFIAWEHWMLNYPNNKFWYLIPCPWGNHDMWYRHVKYPFQLYFWGSLTRLH